MKKIIKIVPIMVFVLTLLASCGDGGLDGTYVAKNEAAKNSMYSKFIFKGGKVKVVMGAMGIDMPGGHEYGFSRNGDKVSIEMKIMNVSMGGIELFYDEKCDEIRLLFGGDVGAALNEFAPTWGKEGSFDPKNPYPKKDEEKTTTVEPTKSDRNGSADKKEGFWDKIKNLFSSDSDSNKKESEFDRNNITYVYIVNESKAVNLLLVHAGHNFIMFEDKNGNGSVYSYGPVNSYPESWGGTPARMWLGRFTKNKFEDALCKCTLELKAKRVQINLKVPVGLTGLTYRFYSKEQEYFYEDKELPQKFDRWVKFSVKKEDGKKMIDAADAYLLSNPDYAAVTLPGGKGQCDNMTSEIAGAGGLGYWVGTTPNWSFNNILDTWKGKFIDHNPK